MTRATPFALPGDGAAAIAAHERAVLDAGGVVLRYGHFHRPGPYQRDSPVPPPAVHMGEAARRTVEAPDAPSGFTVLGSRRTRAPRHMPARG